MRSLLKIVAFLTGIVVVVLLAAFCWLYFYSRDLPDISALAQYAPASMNQVSGLCLWPSIAVSYEGIGNNLRDAIRSVEANENDPGALSELVQPIFRDKPVRVSLPVAVGRGLFCSPSKELRRHFDELRTAIQLDRHYSRQQLFTIFSNRVYLGPGLTGVQQGAEFYFHKNPHELSLVESALLAGLIRAPSLYSPSKHPDRALQRRNLVIDTMVENGEIKAAEAQTAKAEPLGVIADTIPTSR